MLIPVYVCLWCGYAFPARKTETDRVRQCPRCNHIDLILVEEIVEMAEFAKKQIETTPLGAIPFVDTCRAIFFKKGLLRYRGRSTLNLEAILYRMAKEGKPLKQAISETFQKGE